MREEKLLAGFFGRKQLVQVAELDHAMDSSTTRRLLSSGG
jgi:hypothetical protein